MTTKSHKIGVKKARENKPSDRPGYEHERYQNEELSQAAVSADQPPLNSSSQGEDPSEMTARKGRQFSRNNKLERHWYSAGTTARESGMPRLRLLGTHVLSRDGYDDLRTRLACEHLGRAHAVSLNPPHKIQWMLRTDRSSEDDEEDDAEEEDELEEHTQTCPPRPFRKIARGRQWRQRPWL